jgi:hypothetical protein
MAIFSVIDNTSLGDQFYEGMVKDAANWAIMETEITDARGVYASTDLRFEADEAIVTNHTHGTGGVVWTIVANEAALGTGATDGEQKICSVTGNRYMWEAGSTKWQPFPGNQYATSGLPTTAYNILTGTRVYDTTVARMKYWNGTAFIPDDVELRRSFLL